MIRYIILCIAQFTAAPVDYTALTTTVTFPAGVTVQTVNVSTIDDSDPESAESFMATLSNPTPSEVVVISQPTATINIADNEGRATGRKWDKRREIGRERVREGGGRERGIERK